MGGANTIRWGVQSSVGPTALALVICGSVAAPAQADVAIPPDPLPRTTPPTVSSPGFRPSWDLDGIYLWMGPIGAASHVDDQWDSTFGVDATVIRVRERETLGALGATLGGSKWTARDGGRVWLDALAGTPILGHMVGLSAGPIVEFSDFAHPRAGASVGLWGFAGITPFARIGTVSQLGMFAEVGVHIALPVIRR
jgi:hypothetical protein